MDRRAHFIRSQVNEGNIQLAHCPSKFMEADLATKMMPRPGFEDLRARMGLIPMSIVLPWSLTWMARVVLDKTPRGRECCKAVCCVSPA